MSTLNYGHTLDGKGLGEGLPFKRASHLYDAEPRLEPYPNVFSPGLDSDLHAYDNAIYLRLPHLPILFVKEPYIDNHRAGGATFTRRQFFVLKKGQPLMASHRRESSIIAFDTDASLLARKYADPANFSDVELIGYTKGTGEQFRLTDAADTAAEPAGFLLKADYDALPASAGAGATGQEDYEAVEYITPAEFDTLADVDRTGWSLVYNGEEDTNDKIETGGADQFAAFEEALFGATARAKYVSVDADAFYMGAASRAEGFIYPSTGGAPRTVFFNETDEEAEVTLPKPDGPNVLALTATDVTVSNVANWADSALVLPVRPTIGFANTDLEQTQSYKYHGFSTGTDVHQPFKKGRMMLPYVDVDALVAKMASDLPAGTPFNFTDTSGGRSGIKVGIFDNIAGDGSATSLDIQNAYSLLRGADAGYANLYFNFRAPFLVSQGRPGQRKSVVPDLFGNYTMLGAIAVDNDTNDFGDVTVADETAAAAIHQPDHVVGKVLNVYDTPRRYNTDQVINPVFQTRFDNAAERTYLSEGYRRLAGSADTAGMPAVLADFLFMLLGGSSKTWAKGLLPRYGGLPRDLAKIAESLVMDGIVGMVEVAADTVS